MKVVRLEQWAIEELGDKYTAPEVRARILSGIVYGHHRKADGTRVSTSRVVAVDGLRVRTVSGTQYQLGDVAPEYLAYLKANGIPFDEKEPIKLVSEYTL